MTSKVGLNYELRKHTEVRAERKAPSGIRNQSLLKGTRMCFSLPRLGGFGYLGRIVAALSRKEAWHEEPLLDCVFRCRPRMGEVIFQGKRHGPGFGKPTRGTKAQVQRAETGQMRFWWQCHLCHESVTLPANATGWTSV